jgi:hypothetical protein
MRARILNILGGAFTLAAWVLTIAFFVGIIIVTYVVR